MPQVELSYTKDLSIDCIKLFKEIERLINEIDSSAGACKSRAFCIDSFLHTHCILKITMLKKSHRDQVFMNALLKKLQALVVSYLPKNIFYSIDLKFSAEYYLTLQTI